MCPLMEKIEIVFPAGFDLSGVATVSNQSGITGTFTIAVNGSTVTVTRNGDGGILTGGTPATFRLNSILNPAAGQTGTFGLTTKTSVNVTLSSTSLLPGVVIISDPNPILAPVPNVVVGGGGGGGGGGGAYVAGFSTSGTGAAPSGPSAEEGEDEEDDEAAETRGAAPAFIAAFADTFGHWAESYINKIAALGIVQGKTPTEYAPDDNISRAELLKIAVNSFSYVLIEDFSQNPLPDVDLEAWYAPYVKTALENQIIYGFDTGLEPDSPASRGMAVTILVKAAGFTDVDENFFLNYSSREDWSYAHFPDVPLEAYYAPFAVYLFDIGVINGYQDGRFGGEDPITRAEIAKIVVNILETYGPIDIPLDEQNQEGEATENNSNTEGAEENDQMMEGQGLDEEQ